MDEQKLSFGQKAVGLTFNPSGDEDVIKIKQGVADLIDLLDTKRAATADTEVKRMCAVAITELQTAQMWGVKAVTWEAK